MTRDALAIGAHPDDVDVGIGGLVCKLAQAGRSVAILDLTRGELASRGTVAERDAESSEAARILGAVQRLNAGLPDGGLANTPEQRNAIIPFVRELKPSVVFAPMDNDRHPDHGAAHALMRDALYFAGVTRIETGHEPFRPPRIYYYRVYGDPTPPQLIVDISDTFETKIEALRAYRSQFHNPSYSGPETYVASEAFWEHLRTRAAILGHRAGVQYGEALYTDGPVGVELPPGLELKP